MRTDASESKTFLKSLKVDYYNLGSLICETLDPNLSFIILSRLIDYYCNMSSIDDDTVNFILKDIETVKYYISRGYLKVNKYGLTVILKTSIKSNWEIYLYVSRLIILEFIKKENDYYCCNYNQYDLFVAAVNNDLDMIKRNLHKKCLPCTQCIGHTPTEEHMLTYAAMNNNEEIIDYLISLNKCELIDAYYHIIIGIDKENHDLIYKYLKKYMYYLKKREERDFEYNLGELIMHLINEKINNKVIKYIISFSSTDLERNSQRLGYIFSAGVDNNKEIIDYMLSLIYTEKNELKQRWLKHYINQAAMGASFGGHLSLVDYLHSLGADDYKQIINQAIDTSESIEIIQKYQVYVDLTSNQKSNIKKLRKKQWILNYILKR